MLCTVVEFPTKITVKAKIQNLTTQETYVVHFKHIDNDIRQDRAFIYEQNIVYWVGSCLIKSKNELLNHFLPQNLVKNA